MNQYTKPIQKESKNIMIDNFCYCRIRKGKQKSLIFLYQHWNNDHLKKQGQKRPYICHKRERAREGERERRRERERERKGERKRKREKEKERERERRRERDRERENERSRKGEIERKDLKVK